MTVLHARTVQTDGQVREVAAADVRANNGGSAYPLYEDTRSMSFSLPGIEDNCVIDYEWEVKDQPMIPGQFWRGWRFNGTYPIMRSRFVAHVPADQSARYQIIKANTITEEAAWKPVISLSADGKTRSYIWERANIAPFADEPGMPPYYLINTRAVISSLNSWQAAADWYWKLYQPSAVANDAIHAKTNALIAGKSTDEAKARAVYDWVANHVRYVGLEFGVSAYQPHDAAVTFDKLYGDCKDKATLLITMLGVAGIKASPVLLSANDSRTVHTFLPDLSWFDHCIVAADIGGKNVWLDATSEACAYGDIPAGDRGADALVIRDGIGKFEVIPPYRPEQNGIQVEGEIHHDKAGKRIAGLQITAIGSAAQGWRASLRAMTPQQRHDFAAGLFHADDKDMKVTESILPDEKEKTDPFLIKCGLAFNEADNDVTITYETGFALHLGDPLPLKLKTRTQPLVMLAQQHRVHVVFDVPKGYIAASLPPDMSLSGPLHRYEKKTVVSKDGKTVTLFITDTTEAGQVMPDKYAALKTYVNKVADAMQQDIVLIRHQTGFTIGHKAPNGKR